MFQFIPIGTIANIWKCFKLVANLRLENESAHDNAFVILQPRG